jgi:hypothetical protein
MKMLFQHTAVFFMCWFSSPSPFPDGWLQPHEARSKQNAHSKIISDQFRQHAPRLFTPLDAQQILGEPAHLSDSATMAIRDTFRFRCTYTADNKERQTEKTVNVYFMYEHFSKEATAKNLYTLFKTSNENAPGMKALDTLGDEAFFQSDEHNFALIIARKGNKLLRIKVNKLTARTSSNALLESAMRIVARM